jgi:acyl transferase domain-containing protein
VSTLWAFPGQGAQQPGMLHALPEAPVVQACIEQASAALGEDVRLLDSPEALQATRAVQLCLLIAGVAASRLLSERGHRPDYVAGLSIGAYAAAVVAGALDYADAVCLVALRGELMQRAYPDGYGMTAILGLDQSSIERLLAEADGPVYLANINAENPAGDRRQRGRHGRRRRTCPCAGGGCGETPGHERAVALRTARCTGSGVGVSIRQGRAAGTAGTLPEQQLGAPDP